MVSGSQTQHDQMLSQMQDMNSQMLELELRVRDVEAENARLQTEVDARHYEKVSVLLKFLVSQVVPSSFRSVTHL